MLTRFDPSGAYDHLAFLDFAVVVASTRRKDSPMSSMRFDLSNNRSSTASAMVGSPMASCQLATGSWLVSTVERSWARSSTTSSKSAAWSELSGRMRKSSITKTSIARPGRHEPRQAAIGAGDGELVEHAGGTQVKRAVAVTDGRVGERTAEIGLADAGRAHDKDDLVLGDPVALARCRTVCRVEATGTSEVDVLDHSRELQLGGLQHAIEAPVAPGQELFVDEQPEAVLEAQIGVVGLLALFDDPCRHGAEAKGVQALDGVVREQGGSSFHR